MLEASLGELGNEICGKLMEEMFDMDDEQAEKFVSEQVMRNPFTSIVKQATVTAKEYDEFREDPATKQQVEEMLKMVEELKSQADGVLLIEDKSEDDDGNDDGTRH